MLFSRGIKAGTYPNQKANESLSRPSVFYSAYAITSTIVLGNVLFDSSVHLSAFFAQEMSGCLQLCRDFIRKGTQEHSGLMLQMRVSPTNAWVIPWDLDSFHRTLNYDLINITNDKLSKKPLLSIVVNIWHSLFASVPG